MAALLVAHPGAAKEKDKVRPPLLQAYLLRWCVVLPPACIRGLTRSPSRCADWEAAPACCRSEPGVGGSGGGAAGGLPGRCQEEGQGQRAPAPLANYLQR